MECCNNKNTLTDHVDQASGWVNARLLWGTLNVVFSIACGLFLVLNASCLLVLLFFCIIPLVLIFITRVLYMKSCGELKQHYLAQIRMMVVFVLAVLISVVLFRYLLLSGGLSTRFEFSYAYRLFIVGSVKKVLFLSLYLLFLSCYGFFQARLRLPISKVFVLAMTSFMLVASCMTPPLI